MDASVVNFKILLHFTKKEIRLEQPEEKFRNQVNRAAEEISLSEKDIQEFFKKTDRKKFKEELDSFKVFHKQFQEDEGLKEALSKLVR